MKAKCGGVEKDVEKEWKHFLLNFSDLAKAEQVNLMELEALKSLKV
jgi:hypothetical protein